jgi:hypothetical protein
MESTARYVEDVNKDPVALFDGLTKNWRYTGWRVTWTVGSRSIIDAAASAGSFFRDSDGASSSWSEMRADEECPYPPAFRDLEPNIGTWIQLQGDVDRTS